MSITRTRSQLTVRDTDPLVSCHRVQDIHILPGVALLDAVYKTLRARRMDLGKLALRSIVFHEPVVTNTQIDRKLTVTLDTNGETGRVAVTSLPWKHDRAHSDTPTTHMTCQLIPSEPFGAERSMLALEPVSGTTTDLDSCYAVTRQIGIFHDGFMKCSGRVALLSSGQHLGEVALGPEARDRASDFLLHPVLLDCSTIVPLFPLRDRLGEASLFIPFGIEEFQTVGLAGHSEVRVLVEPMDGDIGNRELLRYCFTIFDRDGRKLVSVRNFTVKRVRSLQGINALLQSSASVPAAEPPPPAPQPARPVAVPARGTSEPHASPLLELIATLIAPHYAGTWTASDAQKPFFDLGLDSLILLEMADELERRLAVRIYPTALFEHPSAAALASHLAEEFPEAIARYATAPSAAGAVAVAKPIAAPVSVVHNAVPLSAAPAPDASALEILVPRWLPVRTALTPSSSTAVVLLETGADAELCEQLATHLGGRVVFRGNVTEFSAALEAGLLCDEVCLVNVDHDVAFVALKALIKCGRLASSLILRALTLDCFRVHDESPRTGAAHGTGGLLQSASREYPQLLVSQFDLLTSELTEGSSEWLESATAETRTRTLRALRAGRTYERVLCPTRPGKSGMPAIRVGGVYLVVGGASGVGLEFVRHLRRTYAAKVAVVGRRPESEELVQTLSAEGEYGRELLYLQAAVDDEPALARAIFSARERLGELHGIVHSAMVLEDARLAEMDPAAFARVLRPKVAGAQALARATASLDLEFLLFFSSAQSFVGNVGQANYAAASTFLDGFAAALRSERAHPVVVINWGYWSEVGAVASERYRQLMARQGVHGLKSAEALAALETVLVSDWEQALIFAAEESVLEQMGLDRALVIERPGARASTIPAPPLSKVTAEEAGAFVEMEQAMPRLLQATRRRVGQILHELLAGRSLHEALTSGAIASQHARLAQVLATLTSASEEPGLGQAEFESDLRDLCERFPSVAPLAPLLIASVSAYPSVLAGSTSGQAALFPSGSPDLVRPVYGESAVASFYNERVAQAVASLAAARREPLRILEIGAGTGSTTVRVLESLARHGATCEYWYTDLWDKLVSEAKARLGPEHPELRFAFFDVGLDPHGQGLREEFDVVVATNVLHATRDLRAALRHVKRLLRPGGALILSESVEVQEYSTYTFGLLPGWWNAADADERLPSSPLASAERWRALLRDEGFGQVRGLVPEDSGVDAVRAQQVFLGVSDGELRATASRRHTPAPSATSQGLPPALAGKLRPFEPLAAPRPKHIATFKDARENVWVFLNNPPANMFTEELLGELCATLQSVATLAPAAGRIVYLSHFGEYFSLGGDRSEIVRHFGDPAALAAFAEKARALIGVITSLDALVVAVVNGTAQGGGLETLLATDLQVVRAGVKLGLPEIKSGLLPGMGGLSYLQDLLGPARTKRLVLLGDLFDAEEALDWGMISHVVDEPFAAALALGDAVKHIDTALFMKRLLGRENGARLTADIDDWASYVTSHADWVDTRRISNSRLVVTGRAAMKAS